jgi:CRISPR system Cascade subunit CasB
MAEPSIFDLFRRLEFADPCELENIALCAAAIANVRDDDPRHPARVLGPPGPNATEQALLKPTRFRRLIDARDSEDRLTVLRRAIAVGGFRMNVRELAYACFFWTDMTRQDWLFEYYGARTDPTTDSEDSPR